MISTVYIITKIENDWYVLRCYEKNENQNRYEIVWSYNGSRDAVIYELKNINISTKELKMREEIRINGVYLKADKVNGVREIDYSDLTESDEVSSPKEFLKALKNGESAIAFFDGLNEEIYDEIEKNYGPIRV